MKIVLTESEGKGLKWFKYLIRRPMCTEISAFILTVDYNTFVKRKLNQKFRLKSIAFTDTHMHRDYNTFFTLCVRNARNV